MGGVALDDIEWHFSDTVPNIKNIGSRILLREVVHMVREQGKRTPAVDEIAQCLPHLQRQITLILPKLIAALCKTAATAFTRREATLESLRGKRYDYNGILLMTTLFAAQPGGKG